MKFSSVLDVQTFLLEVGAFSKISESLTKDYKPTSEELGSFIKKRTEYVGKIKDYRKSANQKANWRENRTKMMKGIKAFHKSVEGKRFHRKMGRFLASRITRKTNESLGYNGFLEQLDFLVGLNSVKQHLYVEMDYFHQANVQIELEEMVLEYAIPTFRSLEEKIINGQELTEDELVFAIDLVSDEALILSLAEVLNKDSVQVKNLVNEQVEKLEKEGIAKEDKWFYPKLVECLKTVNWETISGSFRENE